MTALIDREILFGNPDRAMVRLSPDGQRIAYLAPSEAGVLNVFMATWDSPQDGTQLTFDEGRGISSYAWAFDDEHILYVQDKDGDENFHVYALKVATKEVRDLTPFDDVRAGISQMSHLSPNKLILSINDRNPQFHELYEADIATGELTRVQENEQWMGFLVDEQYRVRQAQAMTPTGSIVVMSMDGDEPELVAEIPHTDTLTTSPVATSLDGNTIYWFDSRDREMASLVAQDVASGEFRTLFEPPTADISGLMMHPQTLEIEALSWTYDRKKRHFFDARIEGLMKKLDAQIEGDLEVISRSHDDSRWILASLRDDGPVAYYAFETATDEASFLFTNRASLEGLPLVKMEPKIIEARDGLKLVSYLSLPEGDGPFPMVLDVHGGPWARDGWGYNPLHQLYANRGYAVLSVNFRGSTGLGKAFTNAGDFQWGRAMHDDLLDAVQWAIDEGIADKDRVAIAGGSYGGYATLWGMTNTPDVFACGVDIVGPSNLETLLASIPPYWAPAIEQFAKRVGDPRTEEGQALLKERSPLTYVDNIKKPLLIAQGANDPRVKQAESDQIVQSMQEKGLPVTYVLYPDEGHGFARPENRLTFYGVMEAFLAEHLGGRYQPLEDFTNSTIHVPEGAQHVGGLEDALRGDDPARLEMPTTEA